MLALQREAAKIAECVPTCKHDIPDGPQVRPRGVLRVTHDNRATIVAAPHEPSRSQLIALAFSRCCLDPFALYKYTCRASDCPARGAVSPVHATWRVFHSSIACVRGWVAGTSAVGASTRCVTRTRVSSVELPCQWGFFVGVCGRRHLCTAWLCSPSTHSRCGIVHPFRFALPVRLCLLADLQDRQLRP